MLIHYNRVLREGVLSSESSPDRVLNQEFFLILLETFFVSSLGFVSSRQTSRGKSSQAQRIQLKKDGVGKVKTLSEK